MKQPTIDLVEEAKLIATEHPSKDARWFAMFVLGSINEIEANAIEEAIDNCAWYVNRTFIRLDDIRKYVDMKKGSK